MIDAPAPGAGVRRPHGVRPHPAPPGPGEPKTADWYTEDGHWPPHTQRAPAGRTDTSPVTARMAVAAGFKATESLRTAGAVREVPPLDPALSAYFESGQTA